jgi:hypothetical protein
VGLRRQPWARSPAPIQTGARPTFFAESLRLQRFERSAILSQVDNFNPLHTLPVARQNGTETTGFRLVAEWRSTP